MTSPVRWSRRVALPLSVATAVACSGSTPPDSGGAATATPKCPSGRGPAMALIAQEGARTFCMDSTEVTRGQYRAFVASGEKPVPLREGCRSNASLEPDQACSTRERDLRCTGAECDQFPQACIDYCDAEAFCSWAGKSLCGTDEGKELTKDDVQGDWTPVWVRVCRGMTLPSGAGATLYPYGDAYEPSTCNTPDRAGTGCRASGTTCRPTAVGTLSECRSRGAYSGVYDLMGNVREFVFFVKRDTPAPTEPELVQGAGGDYDVFVGKEVVGCHINKGAGGSRLSDANSYTGFRCCAVPK